MTSEQEKIDEKETVKEVTDGAKYNDSTATMKAIGLSHIIGSYVKLVKYSHTRGEPTKFNKGNGDDDKADYHTAKLSELIKVTIINKQDDSKNTTDDYDGVFLTETTLKQLKRIPDLIENLTKEEVTIRVRVGTKYSDNYHKYYTCFFFMGQPEYDNKDHKFKTN